MFTPVTINRNRVEIRLLATTLTGQKVPAQEATVFAKILTLTEGQVGEMTTAKAVIDSLTPEDLHTRQTVERIVAYYLPSLVKRGAISKVGIRESVTEFVER